MVGLTQCRCWHGHWPVLFGLKRNLGFPEEPLFKVISAFCLEFSQQGIDNGTLFLALCFRASSHLKGSVIWASAWEAQWPITELSPACLPRA